MTTQATAPALTGEALRQAVAEALPGWRVTHPDGRSVHAMRDGAGLRVLPYDDGEAQVTVTLDDVPAAALPRVLSALRAALAGPCPTCGGSGEVPDPPGGTSQRLTPHGFVRTCPDCRGAARGALAGEGETAVAPAPADAPGVGG
jgi:hypothetical protein